MDISIIIPCYNVEDYLEQCLTSLVNQQTKKEYEILCINDGSTDNTLKIIQNYGDKYKNLKIIDQDNKGLSGARNIGLRQARGKYIMFIDSDDYLIREDALEILYNTAETQQLDFVIADFEYDFQDKNKNYKIKRKQVIKDKVISGKEMYDIGISTKSILSVVWNKLYRRDFLIDNNLFFLEGIVYEDIEFTPKAYYLAKKVFFVDKCIYAYRQREGSIMHSKKQIRVKDYFIILKSLSEFNKRYKSKSINLLKAFICKEIFIELKRVEKREDLIDYYNSIITSNEFRDNIITSPVKYKLYLLLNLLYIKCTIR